MRWTSVVLGSLGLVCLGGYARAQPASDSAPAERLFDEASALVERGDLPGACAKFAESQRLGPAVGTQYNLALCYERIGKLGSAWKNYREVERLARETGNVARAQIAHDKLAALEPRVPHLVLSAKANDVLIHVDGVLLDRTTWAFYPVDSGTHTIVAMASARTPWEARVDVPAVAPDGSAPAVVVAVPALAVATETRIVTRERANTRRTLGFVIGGIGVASLAAAVVTGIVVLDAKSTADASCTPTCTTQAGRDAVALGKTLIPINAVVWGVGLVALGTGTALVLSARSSPPERAATLRPWVGPTGAGVDARVRW